MDNLERNLKIFILLLACTIFFAAIVIYSIKYFTFKLYIQKDLAAHNESMESYLHNFERDHKIVAESFLSVSEIQSFDVGDTLNSRIKWSNVTSETSDLFLSDVVTNKLEVAGKEWINLEGSIYSDLDFRWMTENIYFSQWSIWNSKVIKDYFTVGPQNFSIPKPDYKQLLNWAKLRYLHGLHNDDLIAAQSEIRRLAHLIETHETGEATDCAIKIYQLEADVATNHKASEVEFQPIAKDLIQSLTTSTKYLSTLLHPTTRDDLLKTALKSLQPHFGLCGRLEQYFWNRSIDIFRPIPFNDSIKIIDKFAKTSPCRREYESYQHKKILAKYFLNDHQFFNLLSSHKYLHFLFRDSIGLIVDASTRQKGPFVYRDSK